MVFHGISGMLSAVEKVRFALARTFCRIVLVSLIILYQVAIFVTRLTDFEWESNHMSPRTAMTLYVCSWKNP